VSFALANPALAALWAFPYTFPEDASSAKYGEAAQLGGRGYYYIRYSMAFSFGNVNFQPRASKAQNFYFLQNGR
jgi:hypothetical protein